MQNMIGKELCDVSQLHYVDIFSYFSGGGCSDGNGGGNWSVLVAIVLMVVVVMGLNW